MPARPTSPSLAPALPAGGPAPRLLLAAALLAALMAAGVLPAQQMAPHLSRLPPSRDPAEFAAADPWFAGLRAWFSTRDVERLASGWMQFAEAYIAFDLEAWRPHDATARRLLAEGWPAEGAPEFAAALRTHVPVLQFLFAGVSRGGRAPDALFGLEPAAGFVGPDPERVGAMARAAAVGAPEREARGEFGWAVACFDTAMSFRARFVGAAPPLGAHNAAVSDLAELLAAVEASLARHAYPSPAAEAMARFLDRLAGELPDPALALEAETLHFYQMLELASPAQRRERLLAAGLPCADPADPDAAAADAAALAPWRAAVEELLRSAPERAAVGDDAEAAWPDVWRAAPPEARALAWPGVAAVRASAALARRVACARAAVRLLEEAHRAGDAPLDAAAFAARLATLGPLLGEELAARRDADDPALLIVSATADDASFRVRLPR